MRKQRIKIIVSICGLVVIIAISLVAGAWLGVRQAAKGRIFTDVNRAPKCRVALIPGAFISRKGELCAILCDRVECGIRLYKAGKVQKLLMSGDNRRLDYNEPDAMAAYAIKHGVKPQDVACDYAGRRTYDSMYRAKTIFGLKKLIVVSQRSHASRAIFLGSKLGIDTCGFAADDPAHDYHIIEVREIPARVAAFLDVYFRHPRPVLGHKENI